MGQEAVKKETKFPTDLTEQFLETHLKNIETIITSDILDTSDTINITNTLKHQ